MTDYAYGQAKGTEQGEDLFGDLGEWASQRLAHLSRRGQAQDVRSFLAEQGQALLDGVRPGSDRRDDGAAAGESPGESGRGDARPPLDSKSGSKGSIESLAEALGISSSGGGETQSGAEVEVAEGGGTALAQILKASKTTNTTSEDDPLEVDKGQLTFDVEGNDRDGSKHFSRRLHWPGGASGVTVGRGYDMKQRTAEKVQSDLLAAGLPEADAKVLAGGAGLTRKRAAAFCREHRDIVITHEMQKTLFAISYGSKEKYAQGCIRRWSKIELDSLKPLMRDIVVDLFYRGDVTRTQWFALGMPRIVRENDLVGLGKLLRDRSAWPKNLDTNRYQARIAYLTGGGAKKKAGGSEEKSGDDGAAANTEAAFDVAAAVRYNRGRGYAKDVWKAIQARVGAKDDGVPGEKTARKIHRWQEMMEAGRPDGMVGPATYRALEQAGPLGPEQEKEKAKPDASPEHEPPEGHQNDASSESPESKAEGDAPPGSPSTNFSWAEFACRDGTPVPEKYRDNVRRLATQLEALREELGGAAIRINSAYRHPAYNARVGGASRSQHLLAKAADIVVSGVAPNVVHSTIARLIREGRMEEGGLGKYHSFTHYDVRGSRSRWSS